MIFFHNAAVQNALIASLFISIISAIIGPLVIMRQDSFGAHSLGDASASGGAISSYLLLNPIFGFILNGLLGVIVLNKLEKLSPSSQDDIAPGLTASLGLGLAGLFIYLTTMTNSTSPIDNVLFGSLSSVNAEGIVILGTVSMLFIVAALAFSKKLLVNTVNLELSRSIGNKTGVLDFLFLSLLGLCVAVTSYGVGAVISASILIGPPYVATKFSKTFYGAVAKSFVISFSVLIMSIYLNYESYNTFKSFSIPVGSVVTGITFLLFLLARRVEFGIPFRRHKL